MLTTKNKTWKQNLNLQNNKRKKDKRDNYHNYPKQMLIINDYWLWDQKCTREIIVVVLCGVNIYFMAINKRLKHRGWCTIVGQTISWCSGGVICSIPVRDFVSLDWLCIRGVPKRKLINKIEKNKGIYHYY